MRCTYWKELNFGFVTEVIKRGKAFGILAKLSSAMMSRTSHLIPVNYDKVVEILAKYPSLMMSRSSHLIHVNY